MQCDNGHACASVCECEFTGIYWNAGRRQPQLTKAEKCCVGLMPRRSPLWDKTKTDLFTTSMNTYRSERDNTERDNTATNTIHNISLSGEGGEEREKMYLHNISLFREERGT